MKYGSWIGRNPLRAIHESTKKKILRGVTEDNHKQYESGFGSFLARYEFRTLPLS
jgi:hypothetical protein